MLNPIFGQQPRQGAWPTLYAATSEAVLGGDYIGPGGWQEMRGHPAKAFIARAAEDVDAAARLWRISEQATGIAYPATSAMPS